MSGLLNEVFKPEIKSVVRAHKSCISSISINSDQNLVASSSGDGSIAIYAYNADKKQLKFKARLCSHEQGVNCVAFHPRRPFLLASCGDDNSVRIWDISHQFSSVADSEAKEVTLISEPLHTFYDHKDYVLNVIWCSIYDNRLFSCSADDTIIQYNLENAGISQIYRGHLSTPTFAQTVQKSNKINTSADTVMSTSLDGTIRFWDPLTGSLLKSCAACKADPKVLPGVELAPIASAILAPNHLFLLVYCLDNKLRLFRTQDLLPNEDPSKVNAWRVYNMPANTPYVTSLSWGDFEKDNKKYRPFVVGSAEGVVMICDLSNPTNRVLVDHFENMKNVHRSPVLAVAAGLKNVIITGDANVDQEGSFGSFVNLWSFE